MAVASLILGIIALLSSVVGGIFSLGWLGSVCGIVAIILGAIARKKGQKKGMATTGLVFGIISLVWGVVATIVCLACYGAALGAASSLL